MAQKVYKNVDDLVENEYKRLSDKAINKFAKGERLSDEESKHYDDVKKKMSEKAKAGK